MSDASQLLVRCTPITPSELDVDAVGDVPLILSFDLDFLKRRLAGDDTWLK